MQAYEIILPGAAERILKLTEDQQIHRHKLEARALGIESRNSFLGVLSAFLIGMTTILGGIWIGSKGGWLGGFPIVGTGLASIVTTFIYGTRERRLEREAKNVAIQQSR